MKVKTFSRGVHPAHRKEATERKQIEDAPLPELIVLPLQQHAGVICRALVKAGDTVKAGQKIADTDSPVAAPIHSPVSGAVKAVEERPHHSGLKLPSVVIVPDGSQEQVEPAGPPTARPTAEDIRRLVREAGIVGLGGAGFPTQIKLTPPVGLKIDSVIINGSECEPYLTVDHRLMVEEPERVIDGLKLLMEAVGAERGFIGIEENKPDALRIMGEAAAGDGIETVALEAKYPQGSEKQLIKSVLDREVASGALPSSVGALVQNVQTAIAVALAVREGRPLTKRVVTVTGAVSEPRNLRVLIGTPVKDLIELCGGLEPDVAKIVMGGPMMGVALSSLEVPVVKGTSGIVALSTAQAEAAESQPCIKCARCIEACPMGLLPNRLGNLAEAGIWEEVEAESALDCLECGACAYVCPAKRPLVQYIRLAKYHLINAKRRQGA
jgi:Na+-translocating ferredoxin:NAD+ oxidoreductase subunit C